MKRELAGSDKQGLAPNILPFFFWVAIAGSDKRGLAPKILQLFHIAWEENCLGRICQAGLGSQNSADGFCCMAWAPKVLQDQGGGGLSFEDRLLILPNSRVCKKSSFFPQF